MKRVLLFAGTTCNTTHLGLDSKSQNDFDDVRFTSSDGITPLHYWIEESTAGVSATVWIKIDTIPAHPNDGTICIYYGNVAATAVSNGANTFIKFEDFEWGNDADSLSTSGGSVTWTVVIAGGTASAEIDTAQFWGGTKSGRFYHDGVNYVYAYFTCASGTNQAIRYRLRKDTTARMDTIHGDGTSADIIRVAATEAIQCYDGAIYQPTGSSVTADNWELFELNDFNWGADTVDIWFNSIRITDNADVSYIVAAYGNQLRFFNGAGASEAWVDNVIVRNWTTNEPTWGACASEETFTFNVASLYSSNVEETTLTLTGNVTAIMIGCETVTTRGFAYGTTSNVTEPDHREVPPASYTANWSEYNSWE